MPGLIKGLVHGPCIPDPAHQFGAGFEGVLARLPAGRGGLGALALADELIGLDLAKAFQDIAAHGRGEHFHGLDDTVRIDDEPAPNIHAAVLVIDTISLAHLAPGIGEHGEGHLARCDHFGDFMIDPHLMDEHAVHAHGENLDPKLFEFGMLLGDRRDFRGSDKGEIAGIEAENHPFAQIIGQIDRGESAFEKRGCAEIGGLFADCDHGGFSLFGCWVYGYVLLFGGLANHAACGTSATEGLFFCHMQPPYGFGD